MESKFCEKYLILLVNLTHNPTCVRYFAHTAVMALNNFVRFFSHTMTLCELYRTGGLLLCVGAHKGWAPVSCSSQEHGLNGRLGTAQMSQFEGLILKYN